MAYQVPQNKEAFLKLCAESNTKFPYSEDISCLGKKIIVGTKTIHNRIAMQWSMYQQQHRKIVREQRVLLIL